MKSRDPRIWGFEDKGTHVNINCWDGVHTGCIHRIDYVMPDEIRRRVAYPWWYHQLGTECAFQVLRHFLEGSASEQEMHNLAHVWKDDLWAQVISSSGRGQWEITFDEIIEFIIKQSIDDLVDLSGGAFIDPHLVDG